MDKHILLALITKDINDLSRIFSNITTPNSVPVEVVNIALSKMGDLATNIQNLSEPNAEVEETVADNSCRDELMLYVDERLATISTLSQDDVVNVFNGFAEQLTAEIKSSLAETTISKEDLSLKETTLRSEVANANSTIYDYVKSTIGELTTSLQSAVTRIESLGDVVSMLSQKVNELAELPRIEKVVEKQVVVQKQEEPIIVEEKQVEPTIQLVEEDKTEEHFADSCVEEQTEKVIAEEPQPLQQFDKTEEPTIAEIAATPVTTVADTIKTTESILDKLSHRVDHSLASTLNNKKIDDLKSAISIADRFRFQRELFGGDGEKMNKTITILNASQSFEEAEEALYKNINIDEGNATLADFVQLLHRRFI